MLFNSVSFAIFLPIVFLFYWFVTNKKLQLQNGLLLLASYFFYACWDWRFLFLLLFSTLIDYLTGLKICASNDNRKKRIWFWFSISLNIGLLFFFKYFNFFTDSFSAFANALGFSVSPLVLHLILPIGISFYTFHGLSYVIDIYKGKINAEKSFIDYAVFVSFFPLLVAGPIERATHLLPQIKRQRTFNYANAVNGMRQILWGLFKKIVIADQCAFFVNNIFDHSYSFTGSTLLVGAVLFALQIYGDFSGYSDIAIGTAKLFGIDLIQNFNFPYFSQTIAEFWRRWNISLSSWFRDYLYIPLGGSKVALWKKIRNTFIIFIVSGFWHGANFTFIIWGLLNAIFILPSIIYSQNRNNLEIVAKNSFLPTIKEFLSIAATFSLTTIAWIFFRAKTVNEAFNIIKTIFSKSLFTLPTIRPTNVACLIILLFIIEWLGRHKNFALENLHVNVSKPLRWVIYFSLAIIIFIFQGEKQNFIYFQF